ncbi:hypothetical protein V8F06_014063, partial [Rhypophila decipiens]
SGGVDERDSNPRLKVLCWEDIDFWILRDPDGNGGRDRLAMQVLLRYHKGENNDTFIEEILAVMCPVAHILTKALAESAIANEGYQTRAEPSPYSARRCALQQQPWSRTRLCEKSVKSDDALTSSTFDARSERFRIAMGLLERLAQYCQRRG